MKLKHILAICDFLLIFGVIVSALYVVILVGYIVKMSLRWDIVIAIFPRPFVAGLIASAAYAVKNHLTRTLPGEVRSVRPSPKVVVPKSISATLTDNQKRLYQQILTNLEAPRTLSKQEPGIEEKERW